MRGLFGQPLVTRRDSVPRPQRIEPVRTQGIKGASLAEQFRYPPLPGNGQIRAKFPYAILFTGKALP
jgi:hypothetical protein